MRKTVIFSMGERLLREAERWIAECGYGEIFIEARVVAVGFYEKLGFTAAGSEIVKSGPFDCLPMTKRLPAAR